MGNSINNRRIISNLLWRFFERCGAQGVTFLVTLVLARLLDPNVYGVLALVTVFTTILQVFVDSGLGSALIQKKDANQTDFSSVFYFNMAVCLVLYGLMFAAAPLIASFYDMPELTPIVRVMGLTLVISGVKNVQQAYVSRKLLFRRFFFATLGGTIGAAVVGIAMAYKGYGVWALVAQNLFNQTLDTTILWLTVKWRPTLEFSWQRLKALLNYGWKLLASGLLDTVYNNLRQLIIGKLYTTKDLAFYNKGDDFPRVLSNNINTSIDSVLLPVMSQAQEDAARVKAMLRKSIMVGTYVLAPLMVGMAFIAEPMVKLLLTEKWLPCVFFLRIFCVTYLFYPIHTANLNALKALGRSDLFLKLEIAKKAVGLTVLLSVMWFGVKVMAYSLLFTSVVSMIINAWPNRKLLNYGYKEQIVDILPSVLLSLVMGILVYGIGFFHLHTLLTIVIQIIIGGAFYILVSAILKLEAFEYLFHLIFNFLHKARNGEQ